MVQYHALALLHRIKQNDKLAISKVVSALVKSPPKGALAQCLQIRIITSVMSSFANTSPQFSELLKYLVDSLHNTNSMVMFEAARALCRLETLTAVQIAPAIVGMRCPALRPCVACRRSGQVSVGCI
jgi:coatomer protein complex subunit gamma